jgi:hypothetical protein
MYVYIVVCMILLVFILPDPADPAGFHTAASASADIAGLPASSFMFLLLLPLVLVLPRLPAASAAAIFAAAPAILP